MAARKEVEFVITARDRTRAVFARIRRGFGRLRLGIGSLVGGLGFAKLTKDALSFATSIEGASRRLGIAGDQLEALKVVAEDDQVAFANLVTIIQRLSRRAGEATLGSSKMAEAFDDLGVSFDVLERGDPEELFFAVADAAKNFDGTLGELQATLQKIGDIESVGAAGFLKRGEDEIRARIEKLRQEGRILGKEKRESLAESEAKARREILELQQRFASLLTELLPILSVSLERIAAANRVLAEVAAREEEIKQRAETAVNNVAGLFGVDPLFDDSVKDAILKTATATQSMASDQRQSGTLR